jgi:hypothetical protein
MGFNGFISEKLNKNYFIKEKKKPWEPCKTCLLNSTANTANFYSNWSGLALLKYGNNFFEPH